MVYHNIENLRKILIKKLSENEIEKPILLPFDKDLLQRLIFEDRCFADCIPGEILTKIDFSNISFDDYDLKNGVNNFARFTGVKINPQTIFDKDLSEVNCFDVEFIGPFDGVLFDDAKFEGSNYDEIANFEENFRQKIKTLVLENSINKSN